MSLPRFHIEGHIYYITTVIHNRLPIFTRPSFIIPLYDSLNFYRYKQEFKLLGYAIGYKLRFAEICQVQKLNNRVFPSALDDP
jgi:hypothetical protein